MKSRLKNVSLEFHKNVVKNILKRHFTSNRCMYPFSVSFFITLRCNLKCSYCSICDPSFSELTTEEIFRLLEKIRPNNPGLYITGGEPFFRKDIKAILQRAVKLKFKPLWLITNAYNLHNNLDCLEYLDYLIVSLDSLNNEKWDKILGVKDASSKIIENIKHAASLQEKHDFVMVANNLINKELIEDAYKVIDFCNEHDIYIAPQPIDSWMEESENLPSNKDYIKLVNDIKLMKKNGSKNFVVTNLFLDSMLKSTVPNCYPTMNPRIFPDGSVFYPCMTRNRIYGNLFDYKNLHEMMLEAYHKEKLPECTRDPKLCTRNCIVEINLFVDKPISYLKDCLDNLSVRFYKNER
jgi:MoaA/NifB/PqqE/SkfB family radical SAM enzyme